MKALLFKEFKLAMHPICYVFILLFPLMILIPSYPISIGFIYVVACYPILFLGANKGQQSNDLLFSTLLPVRKKDIVLARVITVVIMQFTFILIMTALLPLSFVIQNSIQQSDPQALVVTPGLGLNNFVTALGFALIGFSLADIIFFPIYYRNGKSIVLSTLLSIFVFIAFIAVFTIALPYSPQFGWLKTDNIGYQFIVLGVSLIIYSGLHFLIYKISAKKLEKVDF